MIITIHTTLNVLTVIALLMLLHQAYGGIVRVRDALGRNPEAYIENHYTTHAFVYITTLLGAGFMLGGKIIETIIDLPTGGEDEWLDTQISLFSLLIYAALSKAIWHLHREETNPKAYPAFPTHRGD